MKATHASILAGLVLAGSVAAAGGQDANPGDFWFDAAGSQVEMVAPFQFESAQLRFRLRGGDQVWTQDLPGGVSIAADLAEVVGEPLADGLYTYEVRLLRSAGDEERGLAADVFANAGSFRVMGGAIGQITPSGYRPGAGIGEGEKSLAGADESLQGVNVTGEDLIMTGWGTFGDNGSGVVDGKLRVWHSANVAAVSLITPDSTSSDDYVWNYGAQSGDMAISWQRGLAGGKTTVMAIEEDAPANSLVITSNGRVGMGTSTPAQALHVRTNSGSSRLRIDNNGSVWDLWGGSSGLWFSNNTTPLKLTNGAPTNSLVVESDGNVGVGTSAARAALHVRKTNNTAEVRVEDTGSFDGQTMFNLINNGHPKFRLQDSSQPDVRWEFRTFGAGINEGFTINKIGSGVLEMDLQAGGNVTFAGTVQGGSSRAIKQAIEAIDPSELLAKLGDLSVFEWSYKAVPGERRIGPMAEDFYSLFGLGSDAEHIAPSDMAGIALAATRALKQENEELKARLERLEALLSED